MLEVGSNVAQLMSFHVLSKYMYTLVSFHQASLC